MAAVDVFLTQAGDPSSRPQNDEYTGFSVRSVDVCYNSGIAGIENEIGKALATAFVTDRDDGSCWFMPCFSDVAREDPTFYGEKVVSRTKELEVGDTVRFGSTYAGGSSPFCTILEKVPINILVNGQKQDTDNATADNICLEYLPGNHSFKDSRGTGSAYERDVDGCAPTLLDAIDGTVAANESTGQGIALRFLDGEATTYLNPRIGFSTLFPYHKIRSDNTGHTGQYRVLRDVNGRAGRDAPWTSPTAAQLGATDAVSNTMIYGNDNAFNNPLGPGWLGWHKGEALLTHGRRLLLTSTYRDKVVPGMYVIINRRTTSGTGTSSWHNQKCRVVNVVKNLNTAVGASYVVELNLDKFPFDDSVSLAEVSNDVFPCYFVNLSADDACYAYRINRQLNLTSISGRFADPRREAAMSQRVLYKGGIHVPGSFDAATSAARYTNMTGLTESDAASIKAENETRYDEFHEVGFDSASLVQSKAAQANAFDSIPFSRSQVLDLERCFYPCYRMRTSADRLHDVAHSLSVKLDPEIKMIHRIELMSFSMYGKRRVEKEDAAEILDDEYLILRFKELNGSVISNNPHADRAFAVLSVGGDLSTSDTVGALEYSKQYNSHTCVSVDLKPPRKLQTLTLECLSQNGKAAHLGRLHVWLKCYTSPCV